MVKNSLLKNIEFWNKNEILGTFVHGYQFWAGQQSLGTKGLNHENNSKPLTKYRKSISSAPSATGFWGQAHLQVRRERMSKIVCSLIGCEGFKQVQRAPQTLTLQVIDMKAFQSRKYDCQVASPTSGNGAGIEKSSSRLTKCMVNTNKWWMSPRISTFYKVKIYNILLSQIILLQTEMSATPAIFSNTRWQSEHHQKPRHWLQTWMLCELRPLALLKACNHYHNAHSIGIPLNYSQVQLEHYLSELVAQNVWKLLVE